MVYNSTVNRSKMTNDFDCAVAIDDKRGAVTSITERDIQIGAVCFQREVQCNLCCVGNTLRGPCIFQTPRKAHMVARGEVREVEER